MCNVCNDRYAYEHVPLGEWKHLQSKIFATIFTGSNSLSKELLL